MHFAPESIFVTKEMMSPYQLELLGDQPAPRVKKLAPHLGKRNKYVLHYRNLQLYLQLGMKCTNIHRVLKFKQEPWMRSYIDLNTNLRKNATSDFEKDLYKLINNSVFGKTMKNVRNRINIHLVRCGSEENKIRKLIARPSFAKAKIFNHNLAAIHTHKTNLKLNRPVYVGMSILYLSKHFMYDFYYYHLKVKYGDNCNLLYADTDSLIVEIKTKDVYKDMAEDKYLYDFSNYPKDHFLYSDLNKKVIGKFQDETPRVLIREFVCFRAKMYSILLDNKESMKRAKGVKKYVLKKEIGG